MIRPLGYPQPVYREFRSGDVRHSLADISKAATRLGYQPAYRIDEGLKTAMQWYLQNVTGQGNPQGYARS